MNAEGTSNVVELLATNEVMVKCDGLTNDERRDVEEYFASQPTVKEVSRLPPILNSISLPSPGAFQWDLVLVLASTAATVAPVLVPGLMQALFRATDKRAQAEKERKQHEDTATELVPIYDDVGRTIEFVRRPKR
jgi:hypothetical protein